MAVMLVENMKRKRFTSILLLAAAVAVTASVAPAPVLAETTSGMAALTAKLRSSDFRVQVQAALILGKSGDARALPALTQALGDKSVAVRAASAAALSTLGDPAALPALRARSGESSAAVKRRIFVTIIELEKLQESQIAERQQAKVLVKFDGLESQAGGDSSAALGAAAQASRKLMNQDPNFAVLNPTEDPKAASLRHKLPVVLVRTSLSRLSATREGADTVVSANVEFLVEGFPERALLGKLSGNASVKSFAETSQARLELQVEAVDAAVSSALLKSGRTLLAAATRG